MEMEMEIKRLYQLIIYKQIYSKMILVSGEVNRDLNFRFQYYYYLIMVFLN